MVSSFFLQTVSWITQRTEMFENLQNFRVLVFWKALARYVHQGSMAAKRYCVFSAMHKNYNVFDFYEQHKYLDNFLQFLSLRSASFFRPPQVSRSLFNQLPRSFKKNNTSTQHLQFSQYARWRSVALPLPSLQVEGLTSTFEIINQRYARRLRMSSARECQTCGMNT